MDSVNLNRDVLHLILDLCDGNSISQVMKTCHFLNREGVQYLLNDIPTIRTKEQASSFVQFALTTRRSADITHRRDYIDSLQVLAMFEEAQKVAKVLKPFFVLVAPLAQNFFLLDLEHAEEFFTGADAELSASVASLKTLEVLAFRDAGEKSIKVLRALQSRLIDVEVHYDLELGPAYEDMDPVSCLRYSEDTLRCLSVRCTELSPAAGCYQNVRMLTLSYIDIPITSHFVHAFPNLQFLRATECTDIRADTVVQSKRDSNVAEQARNGSWVRLTSYKGSLLILYGMGLACPVSHVYVHGEEDGAIDPAQIRAVLSNTRPLHITIRADGLGYLLARSQEFIVLCGSAEFRRLPSLRLHFQVWFGERNPPDPQDIMNLIYNAVAPSPVTAVVLVIRFYGVTTEPRLAEQPGFNGPPTPSRIRAFLDNMDPEAIADRLFNGNPLRSAVRVILLRNGKRPVTVQRGHQESIVDLDFGQCF